MIEKQGNNPGPPGGSDGHKWAVLATVMVGVFMAVLDNSIVNVALPHIMTSFATNTDRIRWTVEAYAISYAIFTLTMTWVRERVGIRATFMSGLIVFTIASVLCGLSWDLESMIAFRVIQGLGGGLMMPTGFTLITESFPPQQRGTAFGIFGIVIVFAPSLGPTLGGYMVDSIGWRYIFYLNVPVGIVCVFMAMAIIRETKKLEPHPFDFWGFAGLAAFLGCLLVALTDGQREGWDSDFILSLFAFSALGLLVFFSASRSAKKPIINLDLFSNFYFSILALLNVARAMALFGRLFLLPLFFQNLIGYSATTTGLLLSPGALASGIVMPITGPLVDRYGPKFFIFAGFSLMAISNFMYYNLDVTTPYSVILVPVIIVGIGSGLLNTPITATAMNVVKREHISQVSTVLSVIMQVGGAFGIALLGTIMNNRAAFHQAVYAEQMGAHNYATQAALEGIEKMSQAAGFSQYLAELQAPGLLNMLVSKFSMVAGFQDAFVSTCIICIIGLVIGLGLMGLKNPARAADKPR